MKHGADKTIFHAARGLVRLFSRKAKTLWLAEPFDGEPSIFVCNHAQAYGPIAMCAHFELCDSISPWIIHSVLSAKEVPPYVRQDYWWSRGRWYTPLLDWTVPYFAAALLPPILRGAEGIAVYHDEKVLRTFRESIRALKAGRSIVLFPEKPSGFNEYSDELSTGFFSLARMYYRAAGKRVRFYPTYIDRKKRTITVYDPVAYDPDIPQERQRADIIRYLAGGIVRD